MAFDINKLKNKQQEQDTFYRDVLKGYLDTEDFEDSLQKYLEEQIEKGDRYGELGLTFIKESISRWKIILANKAGDHIKRVIAENVLEANLEDFTVYADIVEDKLESLQLSVITDFPTSVVASNTQVNGHLTYKFTIYLDFDN